MRIEALAKGQPPSPNAPALFSAYSLNDYLAMARVAVAVSGVVLSFLAEAPLFTVGFAALAVLDCIAFYRAHQITQENKTLPPQTATVVSNLDNKLDELSKLESQIAKMSASLEVEKEGLAAMPPVDDELTAGERAEIDRWQNELTELQKSLDDKRTLVRCVSKILKETGDQAEQEIATCAESVSQEQTKIKQGLAQARVEQARRKGTLEKAIIMAAQDVSAKTVAVLEKSGPAGQMMLGMAESAREAKESIFSTVSAANDAGKTAAKKAVSTKNRLIAELHDLKQKVSKFLPSYLVTPPGAPAKK